MLDEYLAVLSDLRHTMQIFDEYLDISRNSAWISDRIKAAKVQDKYKESRKLIDKLKEHYDKGA